MKIWLVTVGEPLSIDKENERLYRTGLLAEFLANKQHHVIWWTSDFNHAKKCKRNFDQDCIAVNNNLNINLLRGGSYNSNLSLKRIINHTQNALDFKKKALKNEKPDFIISCYPTVELSYQVIKYAKKHKIPVAIDIRDLWPESIVELFPKYFRQVIKMALFWNFYQSNFIFRHATSILAVSSKYLQYGLKKANRPFCRDLVAPLGYSNKKENSLTETEKAQILSSLSIKPSKFICWFVGYFGQTYDLTPIIQAGKILQKNGINDIQFILSGTGDKYNFWLEKSKGCDNILFTGWIDKRQLEVIGSSANVGLQAYANNAPQGLANKLFEYLSFGLPVLSSLKGENEELIAQHNVGFTYDVHNPQSFLDKLMALYNNPDLLKQMSVRAKEIFEEHFDNDKINQTIEQHIYKVVEQHE